FILSVVMFYDRPTDLRLSNPTGNQFDATATENILERVVNVGFFGAPDINGGGEVVLYLNNVAQSFANDAYADARLKLRPGYWIMLSGTYPSGTPRFSWYRVASC